MRFQFSEQAYMIITFEEAEDFGIKDAKPTDIFWKAKVYDSNDNWVYYIESEVVCNKDGNYNVPISFFNRCLRETEDKYPTIYSPFAPIDKISY